MIRAKDHPALKTEGWGSQVCGHSGPRVAGGGWEADSSLQQEKRVRWPRRLPAAAVLLPGSGSSS